VIMRIRVTILVMLIASACCAEGCGTDGADEKFEALEKLQRQTQAIDIRSNPEAAMSARQESLDAIDGFLNEYPNDPRAGELRERREKLLAQQNSLREEYFEYQKIKIQQISETTPQLPSDCGKMAKLWDGFITRFPKSALAGLAMESKRRWEAKQQEEMKRGFVIYFEEGEVSRVKGPSHGIMTGRPWDPELFGERAAPDPYVVIEIGSKATDYCPVVKDSFHPVWHRKVGVLPGSDEQELTITMRERDVAEKTSALLLGASRFSLSDIAAATEVLKRDDDDDIGRWSGTIRDLLEASKNGPVRIGDSGRMLIKVKRP
jgi:hypothetical protein